MKKLIVIENAKELLDFSRRERSVKDDSPIIPREATLVFENDMNDVQLQNADGFVLSEEITAVEILVESLKRNGLKTHIT